MGGGVVTMGVVGGGGVWATAVVWPSARKLAAATLATANIRARRAMFAMLIPPRPTLAGPQRRYTGMSGVEART